MALSQKHLEARAYAADGIPVFPCRVDGKEPACANGFKDATCDLEQIDAWWNEADFNIGIEPERAGWAVVDVDPSGLEAWEALCTEHADWRSTTVRTPRGGVHVYYVGTLPPTAGTEHNGISRGIDTRGRGSYVLVPPSVVAGNAYKWEGDDEIAPLPAWIAEACARKSVEVAQAAVVELDLPANLARADTFLASLSEVGEGQRNATAFVTACKLRDLGLSPDATYERMVEWNEQHCVPPIDETELALTVGSACKNAQNAAGAFGVTSAAEAFGATLSKYAEASPRSLHPRFYVYDETEQETMREPSWLVPDLLPDASTVMWYGETGSYKSFLALDIALGLAFGVPTFGFTPSQPAQVVYIAGEGPRSISRRRRPAWKIARQVEGKGAFGLICNMPFVRDPALVQEAIDQIRAQKLEPKLIVIDTAANAMSGMNENDAKDATSFIEAVEGLKNAFGCTVLIVHHTGKDSDRGARGSSALKAGVDAAFKVTATRATRAVALQCEKMKDAEERAEPWTFEGKVVGPSLVFFPTTFAEHSQLTASQNIYERKNIGAALIDLNATSRERAVTSQVLATHLFQPDPTVSEQEKQNMLGRATRNLNSLARTKLKAYCVIEGSTRWWHLPEVPETDE